MTDEYKRSALRDIDGYPEPQRTEMLTAVSELLLMRVTEKLEPLLTDNDLAEMQTRSENSTPDELLTWLRGTVQSHGVDYDKLVGEVTDELDKNLTSQMDEFAGGSQPVPGEE